MQDQTSIGHFPSSDKWQFDATVTQVFEDMLQRSIPQYDVMRTSVVDIAAKFTQENATVLDLGCSQGELIDRMIKKIGGFCKYHGVEISDPMLASARTRFARMPESLVKIEKLDLRTEFPATKNNCVVVSSLTLQFIPIEYRQKIVRQIYRSLLPGGGFILIEKVLGNSAGSDEIMTDLYYQLKGKNGYSTLEIERKKLSLEGVLVPVTAKWNEDLLKAAGFVDIDCFWRWMNFAGWLCIKP